MPTPTDNPVTPALEALPPEQRAWLAEAVRAQQAQAATLWQLAQMLGVQNVAAPAPQPLDTLTRQQLVDTALQARDTGELDQQWQAGVARYTATAPDAQARRAATAAVVPRRTVSRVLGPYEESHRGNSRFRVIWFDLAGVRYGEMFRTQAAAEHRAAVLRNAAIGTAPKTLGEALDAYLATKERSEAWSPRTWDRTGADLRRFADPRETPLDTLDANFVRKYVARLRKASLAYQRSSYMAARGFCAWCWRKGILADDPCAPLDQDDLPWLTKRGRRSLNAGKTQLSGEAEARRYIDQALALDDPMERVAAALQLLTGLRSGELLHLRVRDVDFSAGLLWVRGDGEHGDGWRPKTAAGVRQVELPGVLADDFRSLCSGVAADGEAYLFRSHRRRGLAYGDDWLGRLVGRVCALAQVTVVCPHGLRGTYATLCRVAARRSTVEIAALLGHADSGATAKRAYLGAPERAPALRLVNSKQG